MKLAIKLEQDFKSRRRGEGGVLAKSLVYQESAVVGQIVARLGLRPHNHPIQSQL